MRLNLPSGRVIEFEHDACKTTEGGKLGVGTNWPLCCTGVRVHFGCLPPWVQTALSAEGIAPVDRPIGPEGDG